MEHHHPDGDEVEDHDRGLVFDMSRLVQRRTVLEVFAGAGLATLVAACRSGSSPSTGSASATPTTGATTGTAATGTAAAATAASCSPIPEETAGPYPGDGSNGVNLLTESGVVRSDIRSSFGDSSGVADGVPLTIQLVVTDATNDCAPLVGAAVYLWHCDRDGNYSLYSAPDENYLRGVQETDADGVVTFTSIYPACYSGRWPHIHFEVYPDLASATDSAKTVATSQIALPKDVCDVVYAEPGYEQSVRNLAQTSLATDNVFSDGADLELASVTGSVADGYTATLGVAV